MSKICKTDKTRLALAAFTAAGLGIGAAAQAVPSITYTLAIGQNNGNNTGVPGQWTLFVDDTSLPGEDSGIVGFKATITGPFLTVVNDLPKITYFDSTGFNADVPAGVQLFRSPANSTVITGAQDTMSGAGWVVAGFGQTSGDLRPIPASLAGSYDSTFLATQPAYGAHLKIAHGTYTVGQEAGLSISPTALDTGASLLPPNIVSGIQVVATIAPTVSTAITNTAPEPASLGMLGLGGVLLLTRRRKSGLPDRSLAGR